MPGEIVITVSGSERLRLRAGLDVYSQLGKPTRVMLTPSPAGTLILTNGDRARSPLLQKLAHRARRVADRRRDIAFGALTDAGVDHVSYDLYLVEGVLATVRGRYRAHRLQSGVSLIPIDAPPPPARELWTSTWGDEYAERSWRMNWTDRIAPFAHLLAGLEIASILEVGCNVGHNLLALHDLLPEASLYGVEPNARAREIAGALSVPAMLFAGWIDDLELAPDRVDLVFTRGVLMYLQPAEITHALAQFHRVSRRYIALIEPHAERVEPVPQTGRDDIAWRREWGDICARALPDLVLLRQEPFATPDGTEDMQAWLFEKPRVVPTSRDGD